MALSEYLSPVKLNLNLHIVGVNHQGYHLLQGVSVFTDFGDVIQIQINHNNKHDDLIISGNYASILKQDIHHNLIIKAIDLLRTHKNFPFLKISLIKNIPLQAGYGGGSGNAAVILKNINRLFELNLSDTDLHENALRLGADVPMCLYAKPCLVQNIGDAITPLATNGKKYACLLLKPNHISASTKDIFGALVHKNNPAMDISDTIIEQAIHTGRNDLFPVTLCLYPEIGDYLQALNITNPIIARMSGSGTGLFALYDNDDIMHTAYRQLKQKFPNDFLVETHINV